MTTDQLNKAVEADAYFRATVDAAHYAHKSAKELSARCGVPWHVYTLVDVPQAFTHSETHPYQLPGHGRRWVATYRDGELAEASWK